MIVESPAKARTISKFLGSGYTIEASIGHIRDLPQGAKEIPEKYKGEDWAYLGVNVNEDFEPVYVIPAREDQAGPQAQGVCSRRPTTSIWRRTKTARERPSVGTCARCSSPRCRSIGWCSTKSPKEAIHEALEQPAAIDEDLVRAQETRRIVDRLYGYEVSPLLWRKVRPRLSAGRVQSVAVRLIVERERQRMAFVSATYWDLLGTFAKAGGETFRGRAGLGRRPQDSRQPGFRSGHRQAQGPGAAAARRSAGRAVLVRAAAPGECRGRERRRQAVHDAALSAVHHQHAAAGGQPQVRLHGPADDAGGAEPVRERPHHLHAYRLDEPGHGGGRGGPRPGRRRSTAASICPTQPRTYQTKVKNAQEAHEAIRPAGHPFELPETLRGAAHAPTSSGSTT